MGPLRRGLILALIPSPALVEVCDKERPQWDGEPATAMDELIVLSLTPGVLTLIAITAIALVLKPRWVQGITAALWGATALIVAADSYGPILDDIRWAAIREGCIGSPHLFIALAIAICAGMTYGAWRPRT